LTTFSYLTNGQIYTIIFDHFSGNRGLQEKISFATEQHYTYKLRIQAGS